MISNERLEEISQCSDVTKMFAYEQRQMAREMLALRRAFSEPYAYLCEWENGNQCVYFGEPGSSSTDDWNTIPTVHHNTKLYRKPPTE